MKKPTESLRYTIEILTPIHLGSGRELSSKYDYYLKNGKVHVVNMESVIEALEGNDAAITEFGRENFAIRKFLHNYSIKPDGYLLSWDNMKPESSAKNAQKGFPSSARLTWQEQLGKVFKANVPMEKADNALGIPRTIHEQIKTAFGEPYIPGSSIKGSIRTAILSELISQNP